MDPVIAPSVALFGINSRLFEQAVGGLSHEELVRSVSEASNPILWIAGRMANTRFDLCGMLGRKLHRPWGDIFNRSAARPAADAYPGLSIILGAWAEVSTVLMARFEELTDAELQAPPARSAPSLSWRITRATTSGRWPASASGWGSPDSWTVWWLRPRSALRAPNQLAITR